MKEQNKYIKLSLWTCVCVWRSGGSWAVVRQRSDEGVQSAAEQLALQGLRGCTNRVLHD